MSHYHLHASLLPSRAAEARSLKRRLSLAGPLYGNGLPIKIGIDYDSKTQWLSICGTSKDCPAGYACSLGLCAKIGCTGGRKLVGLLCCESGNRPATLYRPASPAQSIVARNRLLTRLPCLPHPGCRRPLPLRVRAPAWLCGNPGCLVCGMTRLSLRPRCHVITTAPPFPCPRYAFVVPACWQACPSNYVDTGLTCTRKITGSCDPGYEYWGGACYKYCNEGGGTRTLGGHARWGEGSVAL